MPFICLYYLRYYLAACLYLQSPFNINNGSKNSTSWLSKMRIGGFSKSDAITLYKAYSIFSNLNKDNPNWRTHLKENHLKVSNLVHAELLVKDMKRKLNDVNNQPIDFKRTWEDEGQQTEWIRFALVAAAFPNYFLATKKRDNLRFIQTLTEECTPGFDPLRTFLIRTKDSISPSVPQMNQISKFFKFEDADSPTARYNNEKHAVVIQLQANSEQMNMFPFNVKLYQSLRLAYGRRNAFYFPHRTYVNFII